jgi:hypothetical protein
MAESLKALHYAEQELGVHTVYAEAIQARDELEKALDGLIGARLKKRAYESQLADREMELIAEARGKHPDMPVTRMDAHMKEVKHTDSKCRDLRDEISGCSSAIDAYETTKSIAEANIKIAAARLQELGGYFEYLAAIKQQQAHNASDA